MTADERAAWNAQVQGFRRRINAVNIPPDMELSQYKMLLSSLDSIYVEVRLLYGDILKQKKEVERLIYRIENKNMVGSNASARTIAAIEACESVTIEGRIINLYDLETELNNKYQDLDSILDVIKRKNDILWNMNGFLKVESSLAGR